MAKVFLYQNGVMPTTAAFVKVTTGTSIKTMLQIKLPSGVQGKVIEWGISFDGSAAATPIECELIETGTVFATVTAAATADITRFDENDIDPTTALITVGTSATGYTSTNEGSITAVRYLDGAQLVAPTNQYIKQYPLGREPTFGNANALRIRVTAGTAVNCYCYIIFEI
jgi:hypothetical protein